MARPTKLTPDMERNLWVDVGISAHRRTMRNLHFMYRALTVLGDDGMERYSFLYEEKADNIQIIRMTLLAELGRIADESILLEAARAICREKSKTTQIIPHLRKLRKTHGSHDEVYSHRQAKKQKP